MSSGIQTGAVLSYTSFNNFGTTDTFNSASASGTNTRTISVNTGAIIIGQAGVHTDVVSCGTETPGSSQTVLATLGCVTQSGNGSTNSIVTSNVSTSTSYSDTISWSNGGVFGRWLLEIDGPTGTSIGLITQCYGACGSPAVTLVNPNATHPINFNQSYTIFYEFQSGLNGFLINVTTNLAKPYSNGQQVGLGVWTASCPAGTTPFTLSCAGQLQSGSSLSSPNPSKGKLSITTNTPVVTGMWIAIGVSGVFSGLDLNQTNFGCGVNGDAGICAPPMQFTRGIIPQIISSSAPCTSPGPCNFASISATGLWSWIQGNVAVGAVPPPVSAGCLNTDLACFEFNSICALTPSNCFVGGIVYLLGYFVFIVIFLHVGVAWVKRETDMDVHIHPAFYPLVLVSLSAFMTAIGVFPVWFMILEIMITTIMFVGVVRATTGVGQS